MKEFMTLVDGLALTLGYITLFLLIVFSLVGNACLIRDLYRLVRKAVRG